MDIKEKILEIMDENGVEYEDGKLVTDLESLQFVSIMIALEDCFEITFPDDMIVLERFLYIEKLCEAVSQLTQR